MAMNIIQWMMKNGLKCLRAERCLACITVVEPWDVGIQADVQKKNWHCVDAASQNLSLPHISRNETHSLSKILVHSFHRLTPGLNIELRSEFLCPFSSQTDFRTGKQAQNALPCNKYENT